MKKILPILCLGAMSLALVGIYGFSHFESQSMTYVEDGTRASETSSSAETKDVIETTDNKEIENNMQTESVKDTSKATLVLSAPSIHDEYYESSFQEIINFQAQYANKILENDTVRIIVDKDTKEYFKDKVPAEILIVDDVYDIWMRDFSTVGTDNPVQFVYTGASMSKQESVDVQKSFDSFANSIDLLRSKSTLILDGGNIVDNHKGRVITTTRFLSDNNLTLEQGKKELKSLLGATEVAILEPDEDVLAHADGMVAFIDDNVLLVNQYDDAEFRDAVLQELKSSFSGITIIEIPVTFENNKKEWEGFNSACGVNLNLVLTNNTLYVPTFNSPNDQKVLEIIRNNTTKKVVPVDATNVCAMGGSVRCLTWQTESI